VIERQAIPTAAGGSAVSKEWKGTLHPLGFFPHGQRGETSQVKGHKLMSIVSFAKNCSSSGSSGHMVSVTSFPLLPTHRSPQESSCGGKTEHPALFLFFYYDSPS